MLVKPLASLWRTSTLASVLIILTSCSAIPFSDSGSHHAETGTTRVTVHGGLGAQWLNAHGYTSVPESKVTLQAPNSRWPRRAWVSPDNKTIAVLGDVGSCDEVQGRIAETQQSVSLDIAVRATEKLCDSAARTVRIQTNLAAGLGNRDIQVVVTQS